uniref:Uncharacterized protein LOC112832257 n=1 Tax=Callorhinus ursinus TaxID=34884 RepID=A0A3Q7Q978_CALUR|nr:uncharacterized protein LOC112832257 [Callorhinus ursinus]
MGLPGSHSALGSVALGPPDKMGSAVDVLAKAGQKGRVRGLEARAGEIELLGCVGAEAECVACWERLHENPKEVKRVTALEQLPPTHTNTPFLIVTSECWDLRHRLPSPGSRKSANGRPGGPSAGGVECRRGGGGEVVQGSV